MQSPGFVAAAAAAAVAAVPDFIHNSTHMWRLACWGHAATHHTHHMPAPRVAYRAHVNCCPAPILVDTKQVMEVCLLCVDRSVRLHGCREGGGSVWRHCSQLTRHLHGALPDARPSVTHLSEKHFTISAVYWLRFAAEERLRPDARVAQRHADAAAHPCGWGHGTHLDRY